MTGGAAGGAAAPPYRRRRWLVWLLAVAVLAEVAAGAVGVVHVRVAGRSGPLADAPLDRYPLDARPAPPDLHPAADRATEVSRLLNRRAAALRHRNRAGWLTGIDPKAAAFRARQAAVFDALTAVPLTHWEYAVDAHLEHAMRPGVATRYAAPVWTPWVTLRYSLSKVDAEPTERPMVFTFVQRRGRWYLANDADAAEDGAHTWRGLWDFGRVVVQTGRSGLVLAHPGHAGLLPSYVQAVDDAVPAVTAVWGPSWRRQVAVLLPDTQTEMAALVGERFALARIAAVAIADYADAGSGAARGQRVVVNPANLDRLNLLGRRIVLRHEITHVASRGATSETMPTWLIEGFADYVGYADAGLPVSVVAQDLRAELRAGRWPGTLPVDRDYRSDSANLALAYEEGWMACRLIAARAGPAGLVRLYRLVGTGGQTGTAAVDAALRQVLHTGYAGFVAQWRTAVRAELE